MKHASVPLSAIMKHPRQSLSPRDHIPNEQERDRKLAQAASMRKAADTLERKAKDEYEQAVKTAKDLGIEVQDG